MKIPRLRDWRIHIPAIILIFNATLLTIAAFMLPVELVKAQIVATLGAVLCLALGVWFIKWMGR